MKEKQNKRPQTFDECCYKSKEWTKSVVEPFDYKYVIYLGKSQKGKYNLYLAQNDLEEKGTLYRTKNTQKKK